MPTKGHSPKPSAKITKKASKKAAKKAAKKVAKKTAEKVPKEATKRAPKSRRQTVAVTAEARHKAIELAAYYRAEKRNFQDGDPVADWLSSEKEVDELLNY